MITCINRACHRARPKRWKVYFRSPQVQELISYLSFPGTSKRPSKDVRHFFVTPVRPATRNEPSAHSMQRQIPTWPPPNLPSDNGAIWNIRTDPFPPTGPPSRSAPSDSVVVIDVPSPVAKCCRAERDRSRTDRAPVKFGTDSRRTRIEHGTTTHRSNRLIKNGLTVGEPPSPIRRGVRGLAHGGELVHESKLTGLHLYLMMSQFSA